MQQHASAVADASAGLYLSRDAGLHWTFLDGRQAALRGCQCFIDLALTETKEQVKEKLAAALGDWAQPSVGMIETWVTSRSAVQPVPPQRRW